MCEHESGARMSPASRPSLPSAAPVLRVRTPDGRVLRFSQAFHIGRGEECEVRIDDSKVSRRHVLVSCDRGYWSFQDLRSANGVFADGHRLETANISRSLKITLGREGPSVTFEVEGTAAADRQRTEYESPRGDETVALADLAQRYFGRSKDDTPVGRQTMMIRKAFESVQKRQQRKYAWVVAVVSLAAISAAGYALYAYRQMQLQRTFVEDLFYQIKSLDVNIADLERRVSASGDRQSQDQIKLAQVRRRDMEQNYDRLLASLNVYNRKLTEPERLILRVTRMFGECEIAAPPEYLDEVSSYIKKWQSSGRFARGVMLAEEKGYTRRIAQEFIAQNLPPQFFYLALQESDFNAFASGPPTYMGIAKGMWQFIPDTGKRYGLTIGPLASAPQPDAGDDRHKWDKATAAAARYIKDIYATDAQASGLLVMAGYNWGEQRVINLIRSLSANPKDRNFWKLLERYRERIPPETYNYVFYIVSAAVIGENPRMFGFPFDSPFKFLETESTQ
jgi:membrane-bound lytic murein transglycosylase D